MLNVNNLKAERARKGLSQSELADKVGLTRSAIYRYENGVSDPPLKILVLLAEVLEVSTDYLVGR